MPSQYAHQEKKRVTIMKTLPFLLLVILALAGCGVRGTSGQTIAEFEKANPAYHYTPPSVISGTTETRTYRNWSWSSVGSYFKPNRSYAVVFENGVYAATVTP